jgi:hypothetical protein
MTDLQKIEAYTPAEFRAEAVAYLGERARNWCLSELLGALRHTLGGSRVWGKARAVDFWER